MSADFQIDAEPIGDDHHIKVGLLDDGLSSFAVFSLEQAVALADAIYRAHKYITEYRGCPTHEGRLKLTNEYYQCRAGQGDGGEG
jgi:hypothetical protein